MCSSLPLAASVQGLWRRCWWDAGPQMLWTAQDTQQLTTHVQAYHTVLEAHLGMKDLVGVPPIGVAVISDGQLWVQATACRHMQQVRGGMWLEVGGVHLPHLHSTIFRTLMSLRLKFLLTLEASWSLVKSWRSLNSRSFSSEVALVSSSPLSTPYRDTPTHTPITSARD